MKYPCFNRKLMTMACLFATPLFFNLASLAFAEVDVVALSKESEDKCARTEKDLLTTEMIIKKVRDAAKLLEEKGQESFPLFKGEKSEFLFGGTYIWIHGLNPVIMYMHPIKYTMEGRDVATVKDGEGRFFFTDMNNTVRANGEGWTEYAWPKPGESGIHPKASFVKLVKCKVDGIEYVVGCGTYDKDVIEKIRLQKK